MFAFKSLMGSISCLSETKEALEAIMQANPLYNGMTEIVEIDYNDAPITEVGKATKEKLLAMFGDETGRKLKHFHADWGPGFYALSADDRLKTLLDILTKVHNAPTYKFNDSNRAPASKKPKVDVRDFLKNEIRTNI